MRKITTAITAAALALNMLAATVPAAAVTGYDSAYAGESAFVNIVGGQTQNFQVFFANTGTTAWVKGTGTQVDLAACLEDKVTCNAQDASEATWNSGWLSATRYASTTQATTPPGSLGTFSYNITAPAGVAAGIYHFNGDVVLASTGEKIHPEGYFQDANTGASAGAPTLTSLTPTQGAVGQDVVISGTGFICTPAFPTVSFGGTNGVVLSCGASSITVDAPTHALGTVTVTVSNTGSGPSNGLSFTYIDSTDPTFLSFTVSGDVMTVTFNEPVCSAAATYTTTAVDWTVRNISAGGLIDYADASLAGTSSTIAEDCDDATATYTIFLNAPIPNGAFVEATLEVQGGTTDNANIVDPSSNTANAAQSRQTTVVAPETTAPTLVSASGTVGSSTITLTFSEAVYCPTLVTTTQIKVDDTSSSTDPTVTGYGSDPCDTLRSGADTSFKITISASLESDTTYQVTIGEPTDLAGGEVKDAAGNNLADDATVAFTSGAGDFTPPTMVDARLVSNVGTTDFRELDDAFTATFSEAMDDDTTGDSLQLQDQDGTVVTVTCGAGVNNVSCDWNTATTTLTVTVAVATLTVPALGADGSGSTPGMQIPFNITTLNGFADSAGNVPNVLGSSDRLVDYE